MKIVFAWWRVQGHRGTAEVVAEILNRGGGRKNWKGVSKVVSTGTVLEKLQAQVNTLRGVRELYSKAQSLIDTKVSLYIDGRDPLDYAIWADDQIRRLRNSAMTAGPTYARLRRK